MELGTSKEIKLEIVKKKIVTKAVEEIVERYSLCDKCDEKIIATAYETFSCELQHKTGESFPEGGSGSSQDLELCKKCAPELIELLKKNGYRIIDSEWDF